LLNVPTNAIIDTNGVITWTPVPAQVPSTNVFTTVVVNFNPQAANSQRLSATNSFTVTVNAIHNPPVLAAQSNLTVNQYSSLTVTNSASQSSVPTLSLAYQLLNPPAGAAIDATGVITWTPGGGQAPATNVITTIVTDSGTPHLSATNSFTVVVNDINLPPVLPVQTNLTTVGLQVLVVTNTATDPNNPFTALTYSLVAAPTNAVIDTNGVIRWAPVAAQVPSTNVFTTVVSNFNPFAVNAQSLSATNSFIVTVLQSPTITASLSSAPGGSSMTISWDAVPGHTYRVQYTDNLGSPSTWQNLPDVTPTTGVGTAVDSAPNASQRFYRILFVQ